MSTTFKKPFDPQLFAENDKKCRETVISHYKSKGRFVVENIFNEFAVDLIEVAKPNGKSIEILGTIECERKIGWKTIGFPFPTLRIPARKLKLKGSTFIVINNDFSAMFIITPEVMNTSTIESVVNKYSNGESEDFISVDPKKCQHIVLKKLETSTFEDEWN